MIFFSSIKFVIRVHFFLPCEIKISTFNRSIINMIINLSHREISLARHSHDSCSRRSHIFGDVRETRYPRSKWVESQIQRELETANDITLKSTSRRPMGLSQRLNLWMFRMCLQFFWAYFSISLSSSFLLLVVLWISSLWKSKLKTENITRWLREPELPGGYVCRGC